MKKRAYGFTLIDVALGVALFGLISVASIYAAISVKNHHRETTAAMRQSAYTTFQASVAIEGIDPSKIPNPLGPALIGPNAGSHPGLGSFETNAVSSPDGAKTSLAGNTNKIAIAYDTSGGNSRGTGFGYAIMAGSAAPPTTSVPLAPPSFRVYGSLNSFAFPITNVATLPPTNPPGTVYRFTNDGSLPTTASPIWNNNPAWTVLNFPAQLTLRAFNSDPQYTPSPGVTATYSYALSVFFARADGRNSNVYAFSAADLASPATAGILLTSDIPSSGIKYSLDNADPNISGVSFTSAFIPQGSQFTPLSTLKATVVSSDPRYIGGVTTFQLSPLSTPLPSPVIVTDNSSAVDPGAMVSVGYNFSSGVVKTAINSDPMTSGSPALTFPID